MSIKKQSLISLSDYCKLLDDLHSTTENRNITTKVETKLVGSNYQNDFQTSQEIKERNYNEKEPLISVLKQLRIQQLQYNELRERLTLIENQQLVDKINSLIVAGSDALFQLQTELSFINNTIGSCSSSSLNSGCSLPVHKSAQREFVETVTIFSKLCDCLDEHVKCFKDTSIIEWDKVKEVMEETVAKTKSLLSESNVILKDSIKLRSTLKENLDSNEYN